MAQPTPTPVWNIRAMDTCLPELDTKRFPVVYRSPLPSLQRFIDLNGEALEFLDVKAEIIADDHRYRLRLTSGRNVGTVPLRAPSDGKSPIILCVNGRFGESVTDMIAAVGEGGRPEFHPTLALPCPSPLVPPVFLECVRYLGQYLEANLGHWRKFTHEIRTETAPHGQTLWAEYVRRCAGNPLEGNRFRNGRNALSPIHRERRNLDYVLSVAAGRLAGAGSRIAAVPGVVAKLARAKEILAGADLEGTAAIAIRPSDPARIKVLKTTANRILSDTSSERRAWRIDMALLFERYVQHFFDLAARTKAGNVERNPRISVQGRRPAWGLAYLEPDALATVPSGKVVIDAKYKPHALDWHRNGADLAETFRHDLHQILAYQTLVSHGEPRPRAILAYPGLHFACRTLTVGPSRVSLAGLPLDPATCSRAVPDIARLLD